MKCKAILNTGMKRSRATLNEEWKYQRCNSPNYIVLKIKTPKVKLRGLYLYSMIFIRSCNFHSILHRYHNIYHHYLSIVSPRH